VRRLPCRRKPGPPWPPGSNIRAPWSTSSRAPSAPRRRRDHGRGTRPAPIGGGRSGAAPGSEERSPAATAARSGGPGRGGEWREGSREHTANTFLVSSPASSSSPHLSLSCLVLYRCGGVGFFFSTGRLWAARAACVCPSTRVGGFSLLFGQPATAADVSAAIKSGSPRGPYESAGVGRWPRPRRALFATLTRVPCSSSTA
jgi:hypothetical protein